ncbi:DUF3000 domain-containing protein [Tsukamurella sp. 8F]|uniref:DUF3000 domain-containing protein n=1 Tax=unclassified Tsukamurella TaxID=2633480 RepID=UPI0023B9C4AE|nr:MULTISPECIES: DUF3000 domain-containing protein [unclassified Tsukamurella]MDF0531314.1 DUF3000 domain-containing protein [Tsukamurella sp. 8J]MDF0585263.1 DUF3000 domain-containing protein [Tsukamurella sp. 8F]
MSQPGAGPDPEPFRDAIDSMHAASVRSEIEIGSIRPPQRLAPYSYAIGAEVRSAQTETVAEHSDGETFGRLILLYDPQGHEAWNGLMRLVAYVQSDVDEELAADPLLPEVAWSWLTDALAERGEEVTALGGTVTATSSVRYGDISGPPRAHQLELRASWTATSSNLAGHVESFASVLAMAAGLPPEGVARLGPVQ